jgi:hypothetical protein
MQAGIHFQHFNGTTGHRYLPETMGAGGAFLRDRFRCRNR